ncbi:hypothetical protein BDZ91DRAFT_754570, partial [Kalaharituber pfeilii]
HPGSAGLPIRASDRPSHVCPNWHPWAPFRTAKDYELAYEFWRDGSTKSHIDHILEKGLDGDATTFQSSREIRELSILANKYYGCLVRTSRLMNVKPGKPVRHWTTWRDFSHPSIGTVYYRDIFECVKLLLKHPPFTDHMHYAPIQLFNDEGERIFGDIHTADWWWSTQSTLPPQSTIELRWEKSSLAWICIGLHGILPFTIYLRPPIHGTPRPTPRPSMLRSTNSPVLSHVE